MTNTKKNTIQRQDGLLPDHATARDAKGTCTFDKYKDKYKYKDKDKTDYCLIMLQQGMLKVP